MSILEFINEYYDVVFKGANVLEDFSNVDEFLLADDHSSNGHQEINSSFINQFSNKDDIVLVEAIPSMKEIEKDEALQSIWLTTPSKIFGWDRGTIKDVMGVNGYVKARINGAGFDPLIAAEASKIGLGTRASMRAWF